METPPQPEPAHGGGVPPVRAWVAGDSVRRRRSYIATVLAGYGYTGAVTLVNLALVPVLVASLGAARYGIWLTTAALVQWGTVATGWLSPGFVKILGDGLAKGELDQAGSMLVNARRLYRSIGLAVVALAIVLSFQSELGFFGGRVTPDVRAMILFAAAWLAFHIEAQVEVAALTAGQRLYIVHAIQTAVVLASGVGAAVSVLFGLELSAVAASYASAAALGLAAYKLARRHLVPIAPRAVPLNVAILRHIFATTGPYALSVAGWVLLTSDIVLLAFLTSPETVATYGIAYKATETMIQLTWRVADSTQPYIVEFDALNDRDRLRRLYFRTNSALIILGGCLGATFFFLGDRFLELWVGHEHVASLSVIRLLSVYVVLQALVHASAIFPFSTARMRQVGGVQLVEGAAKVVLAIALVDAIGTEGVVLASVAAIALLTGWYVPVYTMRLLRVKPTEFFQLARHALILPLLTALVAWLASELVRGRGSAGTAAATAIVAAGVAVGAAATLTLRSKDA